MGNEKKEMKFNFFLRHNGTYGLEIKEDNRTSANMIETRFDLQREPRLKEWMEYIEEACNNYPRLKSANEGLVSVCTDGAEVDLAGLLEWAADRFVHVHKDSPHVDYVITLRERAKKLRKALAKSREAV